MSERDDFLARWSRRKLDGKRAETGPKLSPEPSDDAAAEAQAAALSGEPTAGPDDLLDLPSLEELTLESDIAIFFRKGVPEALRNAALRRMWSLDPGIRDFVGDARDYAYDWNTPGGVPGFGPILASDNAYAMLDTMFTRVGEAPDESPAARPPGPADGGETEAESAPSPDDEQGPETGGLAASAALKGPGSPDRAGGPLMPARGGNPDPTEPRTIENLGAKPDRPDPPARPRRHGGAQPV